MSICRIAAKVVSSDLPPRCSLSETAPALPPLIEDAPMGSLSWIGGDWVPEPTLEDMLNGMDGRLWVIAYEMVGWREDDGYSKGTRTRGFLYDERGAQAGGAGGD